MDSLDGLRYLQLLGTNYNHVVSSSTSLVTPPASQYPPGASVYSSDQHYNSGAFVAPYGYNDGSVYGYHNHPYTGQYFSNAAATASNVYYNPSLFNGYSSGSVYDYPGYGNAPVAESGNMMASCSTSTRENDLLVQMSNSTRSKRNRIAQRARSVDMTDQCATYPEMTAQSVTYPEMIAQSAPYPKMTAQSAIYPEMITHSLTYPEMTTHSFTYPEFTTHSFTYPEMTTHGVTYPEMTTQSATYPEMTAYSASSPEVTIQNAMSPELIHRNMTQSTPTTSFFGSGESSSAAYPPSFLDHSQSLKKKGDNTKNSRGSKQKQTRNSAKRNLRYSPVSSNGCCTQTAGGVSECISNTKVDRNNNIDKHTSTPLVQEYRSVNNCDSISHFTHNTNTLKYGITAGSSVQNKSEDGYDQRNLDATYTVSNTAPEATACDNNATYIDEHASDKSIEMADVNSTPEWEDSSTGDGEEWYYDYEDEEILVGAPIQLKDYLERFQITPNDFKTGHRLESAPMICKGCFHKTSHKKASTKSSEILNILLRDNNNTAKTSKTGDKANTLSCNDVTKTWCTDSIKREVVERKVNKSTKNMVKANKDDIRCRSQQGDPGCSHEAPEWIEQSIEVCGDLKQSSHLCFGCQKPVFDRYVIQVKDHGFWHADCLKCSNCQDNLSDQKSCYVKNEQVFCRNDYNILFGLSCVKCSLQFKREQDWMRVAGQHRYHIACFLCKICKRQLGNNEKYHLVNGTDIYCTNHYREMVNGESSDGQQPPKKAKRNRTSYTEAQIKFLQDRFLRDSNPDGNELEKIATHINLKKRVVQVWFQNNRARLKKSANNNKNGNQENKNPINSGGAGNSTLSDAMSIDWDNSLEQSSLDEHTYPNSASPSHLPPGSVHFMDTAYSLTPALSGPLLCLPSGGGASATMGQESGSLGDGSGASTCGTPRDQVSPHFSDLSNPAYQGNENPLTGPVGGHDNGVEDVAGSDYPGANNNATGCGGKGSASPNVILSALRGSVAREKFHEGCQRRMDTRDQQEQDMRHHMMLFQDQSLRQHPHFHQQPYHSDLMYGSHMGIYGNLYNMYNSYGHLSSLSADQNPELSDSHQSFLRMKTDQSQNSVHQVTEPPFDCHYSDSHIFGRGHLDINSGFGSARATFVDTNCHTSTGNTASSGNSSPLSFLGAPNSQLHPRSSSGQCSFIQGHQVSSPAACVPGHNYGRQSCGSPGLIGGQNGGPSLQSLARSGNNYFTENENA